MLEILRLADIQEENGVREKKMERRVSNMAQPSVLWHDKATPRRSTAVAVLLNGYSYYICEQGFC
jgi:hypothetical protein